MTAPARRALRMLAWAAAVAASAAAGWLARGAGHAPQPSPARLVAAVAPPPNNVAHDDRAAPLLAQRQPGALVERTASPPALRTAPLPAAVATVHPAAAADAAEPDRGPEAACMQAAAAADSLLQAIAQGRDEDRADALLRARVAGVPVPDTLLRKLIDTSPSDRVRLAAIASWLEARAGDASAERAALQSLTVVSNAAVQQDLRRRLVELDEMDRLEALAAYGVAPPP